MRAGTWFKRLALVEAGSYSLLVVAMVAKYAGGADRAVAVFGRVHGLVFLVYLAAALWAAKALRWRSDVVGLAIIAAVPPLATIWFVRWCERGGRLPTSARSTFAR